MGDMTSLSSAIRQTLHVAAQDDMLASKAARACKVKQMWQVVIEICCHPHAQVFLNHTNSVYIIRENDLKVLIAYMDESIFAAEINARREMIKLKLLERFGEDIDDFRILISRGAYKKKHLYSTADYGSFSVTPPRKPLSSQKIRSIEENASNIENDRVRKSLVKAMISDLERKSDKKESKS